MRRIAPELLLAEAHWDGKLRTPSAARAALDMTSLFLLPELAVTAAELDAEHKRRISHRGQAMRALSEKFAGWR